MSGLLQLDQACLNTGNSFLIYFLQVYFFIAIFDKFIDCFDHILAWYAAMYAELGVTEA